MFIYIYIIPFGVYHRLKGPMIFIFFFFIGGVFLGCQKRRFCTLTACIFFLATYHLPTVHTAMDLHVLHHYVKFSRLFVAPFFFARSFRTSTCTLASSLASELEVLAEECIAVANFGLQHGNH